MNKIELKEIKLIGLSLHEKTVNENGKSTLDCVNLWHEFEKNRYHDQIEGKISEDIYGVYHDYEGDSSNPFAYFIGCIVEDHAELPPGLQAMVIPAGTYYKFIARGKMPDCVTDAWKEIWDSGVPRTYKVDFEVYDERSKDWNNGEVDVYLSINDQSYMPGLT